MATNITRGHGHSNRHRPRYPTFENRGDLQLHFVQQLRGVITGIRDVVRREFGINQNVKVEISLRRVDFSNQAGRWIRGLHVYESLGVAPILVPTLFIYIPDTNTAPYLTPEQKRIDYERHKMAEQRTFQLLKGLIRYVDHERVSGIPFRNDLVHYPVAIDWARTGKYTVDSDSFKYIYLPSPERVPSYERHKLLPNADGEQLANWHRKWEHLFHHQDSR